MLIVSSSVVAYASLFGSHGLYQPHYILQNGYPKALSFYQGLYNVSSTGSDETSSKKISESFALSFTHNVD